MQIQYRNNQEDFEAAYCFFQRKAKRQSKDAYFGWLAWASAVCCLAIYVSVRSEQIFAAIVFLIVLALFLKRNWSFSSRWNENALAYAQTVDEYTASLTINTEGLTETYLSVSTFVPWTQIRNYGCFKDRLFIRFLKHRTFIIPFRDLNENDKLALMELLASRQIPKEDC
jgi:hypothetical protein